MFVFSLSKWETEKDKLRGRRFVISDLFSRLGRGAKQANPSISVEGLAKRLKFTLGDQRLLELHLALQWHVCIKKMCICLSFKLMQTVQDIFLIMLYV